MKLPEPVIQDLGDDSDLVQLMEPYALALPTLGKTINILTGFIYDGASIPKWFWCICGHPLEGDNLPAATAHDALYRTHLTTRAEADAALRERLLASGKDERVAEAMWWAVRLAGWLSWYAYTPEQCAASAKLVKLA